MTRHKVKRDTLQKKSQRPRRSSRKQASLNYDTLEPKALLAGLTLGDSVVTFNELNYNPSSGDSGGEWIELHNQLSVDVELSGWRLAEGVDYEFAPGTTIGGGEYLVIAKDPAAFEAAFGVSGVLGGFTGSLSNGGETVHLLDLNDRVMDELIYDDAGQWPVAADGSGATLAKIDEHLGTGDPNSWTFSSNVGGTPGSDNLFANSPLQLSELAGATDSNFRVELHNTSGSSINLSGYSLVLDGSTETSFALSGTIGANGYVSFSQSATGINPQDEDRLFLAGPGNSIADGTRVENTARARSSELQGRWQRPNVATFGSANSFNFEDAIVINEILYNQLPIDPVQGTVSNERVIDYDSIWRFNETDQPQGWATIAHSNWDDGPGLLGFESSTLQEPIRTGLNRGRITYYFETDFQFNGDLDEVTQFQLNHFVDDGAVFYLNGVEIERFHIDSGVVNPNDLTNDNVNNATEQTVNLFNTSALVVGTNRLSVEVHQSSPGSSDLVLGVELDVISGTGTPYGEDPEEWIELYNNSGSAVDLSGWEFADGVEFQFDTGTVLGAGQYLVVARDEATLAAKYPGINIAGEFDGRLSNRGERIQLLDSIGNIADEVQYYDDGAWDSLADGNGASLELRDADADNSNGQAWSASDVTAGEWQTVSYTGVATDNGYGFNIYNEFVFGLLQAGEVLIDDISVISNPGTNFATELIQDGTFSSSASLSSYRAGGNHREASIVSDPDNASESVLRLVATGASEQLYNHVETTLANGAQIQEGVTYQISYRAKWISGSNQVNSRLYFNYLGNTERLERPNAVGTPGAVNSNAEVNIGPTYSDLAQSVVTPAANQAVTISVNAEDPNGVSNVRLWYSVNEGVWQSRLASNPSGSTYQAVIPGFSAGTIVQFYVEGTDGLGARSTFPADGVDSRALYKVATSANSSKNSFQIITLQSEYDFLIEDTNQASNQNIGATAIDETGKIYFDVQTRLRGASFSRADGSKRGFSISFNPEDKYRGVHDSVAVDRDDLREILFAHLLQSAGDIPSFYDDVIDVTLPGGDTSTATLKLARYNDVWADGQYENGSDGNLFDQDLIYTPRDTVSGDPEDLKDFFPVFLNDEGEPDFTSYGSSAEDYRDAYALENNRGRDDFSTLIEFVSAFDLDGAALFSQLNAIADIDQIARSFVGQSLGGKNDFVGRARNHNIRVYENPESGLVQLLPWDLDSFARFSSSAPLYTTPADSLINKLFDLPQVRRLMFGHADNLIQTTFNAAFAQPWANHYASVQGEGNHNSEVAFVQARGEFISSTLPALASYNITTNGGANFSVNDDFVTLQGTGSYKIRDFQIDGINEAIDVTWLDDTTWQVTVELVGGTNDITIRALDYFGDEIHNDSITVTAPLNATVASDNLRISEIHFNPADPSATELAAEFDNNNDFEFIEIYNPSTTGAINLNGVQFSDGVEFTFGNVNLAAGERAVIVEDINAFRERYGDSANVLGQWSGALSNDGERVTLVDSLANEIMSVNYGNNDPWYSAADGNGFSLVLTDPLNTPVDELGKYYSWSSSTVLGGTPGEASVDRSGVVVNEILAHTDLPQSDSIELFNTTGASINVSGWYLSDAGDDLFKYQIPAGTVIAAGGYLVFDESDFNANSTGFALNGSQGDQVFLSRDVAGVVLLQDAVEFDATFNGESLGRLPNGSGRLTRLAANSFGSVNDTALVGPLVISEVNYNPSDPTNAALAIDASLTDDDLEFIEISNPTSATIDLTDWRIRGEVDFDFSAGSSLAAGESIVIVSFDPSVDTTKRSAFVTQYGISSNVNLVGGFDGGLSNSSGRISLQQPDTPDMLEIPRVVVDEVVYDDLAPWADADGSGDSLNRNSVLDNGSFAASWDADSPTPGVSDLVSAAAPQVNNTIRDGGGVLARPDLMSTYSVTFDQGVNVSAGDLLIDNQTFGVLVNTSAIGFSYNASTFTATWDFGSLPDLEASYYTFELSNSITSISGEALDGDGDGAAGGSHFETIYVAIPGDANLDGDVEVNDINIFLSTNTGDGATVLSNLGAPGTFSWSQGDFNADGDVDSSQLNIFSGVQSGDYAVFLANLGRNVRPANSQPATIQPVTFQSVASQPVVAQPITSQPVVSQSVAAASIALPVFSSIQSSSNIYEPIESSASVASIASVELSSFSSEVSTNLVPASESALSGIQPSSNVLNQNLGQLTSATEAGEADDANGRLSVAVDSSLKLGGAYQLLDDIFSRDFDVAEYEVEGEAEEADLVDF